MTKTLILGSGFIASHFTYEKYVERIYPALNQIRQIYDKHEPDVIVNCIGHCGSPNIDSCLDNKSKTIMSNTILPIMIADVARDYGIHFINISSGCIFNGSSNNFAYRNSNGFIAPADCAFFNVETGWKEEDPPNPVSFYSDTKASTDMVLKSYEQTTLLRIRMPISDKHSQRNLITKLLNYEQIVEAPNSITFVSDLVRAVDFVIEKNLTGIYHITSPLPITHSDILEEYRKYHPEHKYKKITLEELDNITKSRRSNCILDNRKIQKQGFVFADTKQQLKNTIKQYIQNEGKTK